MAELTVQNVSVGASLTPEFTAAASGGDSFANTGKILLYIKNEAVASRTVTIASQVECNQGETHNVVVTVPASSEEMVGFFSINRFNDSDGEAQITYDDEADVTVAAISVAD